MHSNDDTPQWELRNAIGLTRRGLLQGCAAAVACAVLFSSLLPREAFAHSEPRATCVAVTDDDQQALTSDDLGRLISWNLDTLEPKKFPKAHDAKAAYVSTRGNRILTAGYDGKVIIHDRESPAVKEFTGHRADDSKREVWVAVFSPDGKHALSGANDGQILFWELDDPNNADKVRTFPYQDKEKKKKNAGGPVAGLAFLPQPENGSKLRFLSTHGYGDVHLWEFDPTKKNEVPAIVNTISHGNSRPVNAVVVLKGGTRFLSAGFDETLRLWDVNEPERKLQQFTEHKNWIWRVALSPDSKLAATASDDGTVRVWNMQEDRSNKSIHQFKPGSHGSMGVAFTKDGRVVYTLDGTEAAKDPDRIKGLIKVEKVPQVPEA